MVEAGRLDHCLQAMPHRLCGDGALAAAAVAATGLQRLRVGLQLAVRQHAEHSAQQCDGVAKRTRSTSQITRHEHVTYW